MSKDQVRVYTPPGTDPDERGRRSRAIARRLAAGEAIPGLIVERLPDSGKDLVILAKGRIAAAGSKGLRYVRTGMARAFLVGNDQCMIGQTLTAPQPIDATAVEIILGPFSVNPDPEGIDG